MLLLQAELGITSQKYFYKICRLFPCGQLLEKNRCNRRSRQLIWLVQLIRKALNDTINPDDIVIIDSFPLLLCQPIRNHRASIFKELADIGYNASKHIWFYGFKVHILVTLSGYIVNYLVTPASVHDIRAVHELKGDLAKEGYHLWTPLHQNMAGAKEHNRWELMAMRRTIETHFSELVRLFDIEHTLARGLTGLQLRLEQIVLAYNFRYFEIN